MVATARASTEPVAARHATRARSLRGLDHVASMVHVGSMVEIVVDGASEEAVRESMRRGLHVAAAAGAMHITAANFGGKLGEFHFPLSELRDPP
jgi:formylmethanofuran--tetrahydromethanopterin N-formyltransferase